ncbi:type II toxin-antitoxin system RelE/ParE family toxin [Helicobacter jaachi]|uniref:Type II toxin-antitoxin system RelE/ParE family toxin n=1 Tax=Helicobacter jaachi TaxID=1677920 RepID=A0A4U8T5M9_9HELI|nr:type II toxin-antitoxin system RelE/ParE family toxin [Helicobacter jaachi]TLD94850.1 type II toxin-antitoxin system RelE/ParE family toxin [Helicobacter jaachi]
MIISFKDKETLSFYKSGKSKKFPKQIHARALLKLDMLHASINLKDLRSPPSNHLEKLSGDLEGFYSIRINEKYRIIFTYENATAAQVCITDYH